MTDGIIHKQFKNIIFKDDEISNFMEKIKYKGIQRYNEIYNSLMKTLNNQKISYNDFIDYYEYDINLRMALYKIISSIEVAMRATINNNYKIDKIPENYCFYKLKRAFNDKEMNFDKTQKTKIYLLVKQSKNLFEFVENADFEILSKLFLLSEEEYISEVFTINKDLSKNLEALMVIRDIVMHNYILISKELKNVFIGGLNQGNSLKSNIINAIRLSPIKDEVKLKKLINDCIKKEDGTNYNILDKYKVYFEEV